MQKPINQDSVIIAYKHLIKANQAFLEVKYWRKIDSIYIEQLSSKDRSINLYRKSISMYQSLDSSNIQKIESLKIQKNEFEDMYKNYKADYRTEKRKKMMLSIATGVGIPVAAIAGFILGWQLAK